MSNDTLAAMRARSSMIAFAALMSAGAVAQPRLNTMLAPPVASACVSSPFGPRVLPHEPAAGSYHYGVDLAAAEGSAVLAAAPGTVIRIQHNGPGGLEMLVQHDGFIGIYSQFGMIMPAFAEGRRSVAAGEKLGVVGVTGVTSGPHLYFGMSLAGRPVDPEPYLGLAQCNGAARRTLPVRQDDGGTIIGGRKYWQLVLPARQ